MKIEKAIEILTDRFPSAEEVEDDNLYDAIRLGIEALKRIKSDRIVNDDLNPYPLPGETKD